MKADKDGFVTVWDNREVKVKIKIHYINSYPPSTVACGLSWKSTDTVFFGEVTCKKCLQHIVSCANCAAAKARTQNGS